MAAFLITIWRAFKEVLVNVIDRRQDSGFIPTPLALLARSVKVMCTIEHANQSQLPDLKFFKLSSPDEPSRCFYEPCVALILSGTKRIMFDQREMMFHPGDFFVTSMGVPTSAHVTEASFQAPYLSLIMRINLGSIHGLVEQAKLSASDDQADQVAIAGGRAAEELVSAFSRLVDLARNPADAPLLLNIVQAEIYARLLQSEVGNWLIRMTSEGFKPTGVVRALEWLKDNYTKTFRIEELAGHAGMGSSTFHHNFRRLTGTSPLQYQKTLRLHAARNLMLAERIDANTAAMRVGYESVPQFNREYSRQFGVPPGRDIKIARSG